MDGAGAEVEKKLVELEVVEFPKRLPEDGALPKILPLGAGADDPKKLDPGAGAGVDELPKRFPLGAGADPKVEGAGADGLAPNKEPPAGAVFDA